MADYTQQIEKSIEALFSNISQRLSTEDMVRVERAYLLAAERQSKNLRILLAGKASGLEAQVIQTRMREGYV